MGERTPQGLLSNLHLGARDPEGGFVMLGKTFKGLTDELLRWQTEQLLELEVRRSAHVVHVRPELVVEIAFDGVQTSSRYPGGVALRFARVIRYRPDKRADEADTIDAVRALSSDARGRARPAGRTCVDVAAEGRGHRVGDRTAAGSGAHRPSVLPRPRRRCPSGTARLPSTSTGVTARSSHGMPSSPSSSSTSPRVIPERAPCEVAGVATRPRETTNRLSAVDSATTPSPFSRIASSAPWRRASIEASRSSGS